MAKRSTFHLALIGIPALAVLAVPGDASAQSTPAQSGGGQAVTRAQLSAQLDASFKNVDANGDKSLNTVEIEAAQAKLVSQAQANVAKRIEAEFARLDSNKDGQLSLAEFKAGAPPPRVTPAAEMLKQFDRNGDGKIGADEYRATPLANFDRLDTNRDGTLSAQEQAAAKAQR